MIASHIFIPGYNFYALQWSGPGLSPVTNLSWVQEQVAKLVANLLILSVLGGRSNYFVLVIVCLLGDCHKFLSTF